jgi:hypothetical protein
MSEPMRFRKKPVVIEARQWARDDLAHDLVDWAGEQVVSYDETTSGPSDPLTGEDWGRLSVDTLEGEHIATPRDWLIKGVKGEFYFCKPDIFEATYESVEDGASQ